MFVDETEKESLHPEIIQVIEDCFPNGIEFCKVIEYYHTAEDLLALY